MAFVVGDKWQGLGLGTKMVDYVLEIAKEMGVEHVYSIILPDNYRALSLTKKMGFSLEYLNDGTVKGTIDLSEEILEDKCKPTKIEPQELPKSAEPEAPEPTTKAEAEAKQEPPAAAQT
jgi:hypothetical protein